MSEPTSRPALLFPRLSAMMFLQYAIWGAWLPLFFQFLTDYRHIGPDDAGLLFSYGAIGAVVAPFVAGQIVDRYMAIEKFVGVSHLLGAVLVWQLGTIDTYGGLVLFSVLYSILYAPTMPLTNALAFHHLPDRVRDFGKVRLWGTVGWIAVGIGMGQWLLRYHTPSAAESTPELIRQAQLAGMVDAFRLSAILGAILGVFSFTLPHTPPRRGSSPFAPGEALRAIRKQPLLTLFCVSLPVSCAHQFYFVHTAGFLAYREMESDFFNQIFGVGGGGLMTIGQISEIFCIAAVPFVARRFARKTLLIVGLLAYIARFALFAYGDSQAAILTGVALHGPVFACFIFLAFMIVDEETTADVRGSAQGLYNLVVVGLGIIVGNLIAGRIGQMTKLEGAQGFDYRTLFGLPMWGCVACLVAIVLFYPGGKSRALQAAEAAA